MWRFERKDTADKAVAWCMEHHIPITPLNIVAALDSLGFLKGGDPESGVFAATIDDEPRCLCPADGHSELCPIHRVNSSPR